MRDEAVKLMNQIFDALPSELADKVARDVVRLYRLGRELGREAERADLEFARFGEGVRLVSSNRRTWHRADSDEGKLVLTGDVGYQMYVPRNWAGDQ